MKYPAVPGAAGSTLLALAALCLGACSSPSNPAAPDPFPVTVTSASGALRVEVTSGSAPVVGDNRVTLTVIDARTRKPEDGLTVTVTPWMPSMGHGTASPTVTAEGGGQYALSHLYFFMPGTWQLKLHVSGTLSDDALVTFQLQ